MSSFDAMEMKFGSLVEIYTTIYGWEIYNILAEILMSTGLFMVPFLIIIYRNWTGPATSQENRAASATSLSRMQLDIYVTLLVLLLAFFPLITVHISPQTYGSPCTAAVDEMDYDNTTYDSLSLSDTKAPVFWYLAMSLGSGINYSAISSMACTTDVVALSAELRNIHIPDPDIAKEFDQFAKDCYLPAKARFEELMADKSSYDQTQIKFMKQEYGKYENVKSGVSVGKKRAQLDYFGSNVYLNTPGLYKKGTNKDLHVMGVLKASQPVKGWPLEGDSWVYSVNDLDPADYPDYGQPDCDQWWSNETIGLEKRLVEVAQTTAAFRHEVAVKSGALQMELDAADFIGASTNIGETMNEKARQSMSKEMTIRALMAKNPTHMTKGRKTTLGEKFENALAGFGVMFFAGDKIAGQYAEVYIAKEVAPMAQAIFLMVIYMVLPLVLVVSCYDLKIASSFFVLIITFKLFSFMWAVADYMHSSLFRAMYPDESIIYGVLTMDGRRLLLDITLYGFIIIAPMVLIAIMGVAGYKFSGFAKEFGNSINPAGNIGNNAGQGAYNKAESQFSGDNNGGNGGGVSDLDAQKIAAAVKKVL